MNIADEHSIFDDATLINAVYEAQVDLKMLAEWLARGNSPAALMPVISPIFVLHFRLRDLSPSFLRH